MTETDPLWKAIEKLLERINEDNSQHGGLITQATIRMADELRVRLWQDKKRATA